MTRLLVEPVEVHRRDEDPDQFLWRGRLYVIRDVLARWTEAGQWWRTPAVTALSSGDASSASFSASAGSGVSSAVGIDDGERDWWRVEADSGRAAVLSGGSGVYDLCFDWSTSGWSLARVQD